MNQDLIAVEPHYSHQDEVLDDHRLHHSVVHHHQHLQHLQHHHHRHHHHHCCQLNQHHAKHPNGLATMTVVDDRHSYQRSNQKSQAAERDHGHLALLSTESKLLEILQNPELHAAETALWVHSPFDEN